MSDETPLAAFPPIPPWGRPGGPERGGPHYPELIDVMRDFLDKLAAASPDDATTQALTLDLSRWSQRLAPLAVPEREQVFAHRPDLPGRGQTMSPRFVIEDGDGEALRATVSFGRYFLGGNGAAHGGAIPLVFDEFLGRFANSDGRKAARTAYLNVNFRSITPIERPLELRGWFVREEGRKRLLRGELRHGQTLCADAEGLFIELKPGQP